MTKILLDEIEIKYNPRTTFEGIEKMAKSIKESTQLQPLLLGPKNGNGKYILLDGERRFRALKKLKEKYAKVDITEMDEHQQKEHSCHYP